MPRHPRNQETKNSMESEINIKHVAVEDGSIRDRAYQIYRQKGGPALDNWLEAEKSLK